MLPDIRLRPPRRTLATAIAVACLLLEALSGSPAASEAAGREPGPPGGGIRVPILMYHRIVPDDFWGRVPPSSRPGQFRTEGTAYDEDPYLYLRTRSQFEQDIAYLADSGYSPISLYQLRDFILRKNGAPLPPQPVVISFDDGSRDWFEIAVPILRRRGFKATFFLTTDERFRGRELVGYAPLTWSRIRSMAGAKDSGGTALFDIESHSVTHRNLADAVRGRLSDPAAEGLGLRERFPEVWRELAESKRRIAANAGRTPRFLALPYGAGGWDTPEDSVAFPIIKAIAQKTGYYGIRTSRRDIANDPATDPYKLGSQVILLSTTTRDEFAEALRRASGRD